MLIVVCILYFWRAPQTIDPPLFDESLYLYRGYALTQGKLAEAQVLDPRTSPLHVVFDAFWVKLLPWSSLYPVILISSLLLLTFAAYRLYLRFFSAPISWLLAALTLIGAAPVVPWLANYYLGPAILWFGLSLPDRRVWRRSLGLLLILLSTYVRPDFMVCFAFLLVCLIVYELRLIRRRQLSTTRALRAYTPLLLGIIVTLLLWRLPPPADSLDRTLTAIPWSYVNYLERSGSTRFNGDLSYGNTLVPFEAAFGPIRQPLSVANELLTMTRNPAEMARFLGHDSARLFVAFGSSLVNSSNWTFGHKLPFRVSILSILVTLGPLLVFIALLICLWLTLRQHHLPTSLHLIDKRLPLLCLFTLLLTLPALIVINPEQRYFMIFPVVLFFVGVALTWLRRLVSLPRWTPALLVAVVLMLTPHPFNFDAERPYLAQLEQLRQSLPKTSVLFAFPATSYSSYLAPDGFNITPIDPETLDEPQLVNAEKQNPALEFVLRTSALPDDFWQKNFDAWKAAYPDWTWTPVAASERDQFALYRLVKPTAGG